MCYNCAKGATMTTRLIHGPQGPTPAEVRMLEVWDVFDLLLRIKPADAQKMACEAAELAEKYAPQRIKGAFQSETGRKQAENST